MIFYKKIIYFFGSFILLLAAGIHEISGQPVPGQDENIQFLVTFGKQGETSWGDDDFSQTWFFAIPKDYKGRFYIRVFDPDIGGEYDEQKGEWDTRTLFSIYGGKGVDPEINDESRGIQPTGNYKSGTLLASRTFGNDTQFDSKYYTFGPFNSSEGDYSEKWGYIFKVIADGVSGDDGNLYKYFLSQDKNSDVPIEGANAFTYEYTFRMWNNTESVSHIYPYIDEGVIYVKQKNFDWDDDGTILVVSRVRKGITVPISGEDNWVESRIGVEPEEVNSSLDFQFHKKKEFLVRNNNVVISLENQRGDNLKFFSAPIGGVPVYNPKISARKILP
ncbi:MAG TPA: hypothetical protein PLN06_02370 [Bacteroidales bacterium]|nr:hypothetical protein [Bacteroidales bacterium]HQG36109.1 hypothetical protein [Bacteroidales bacterium]HQG52075.1 hypothetical protein [Bacteroidales bacterium]HQJ20249.1 hypothetical protein [Bacteroidales bacterium]